MRAPLALLALALLAGCNGKNTRPADDAGTAVASPPATAAAPPPAARAVPDACRQVREHRDEDYTPGGLYAPGVADSAPLARLDIAGLEEPQPRDEPASPFGNRTPYTMLGRSYKVLPSAEGYVERGIASWYGQKFHGRQTSSRETYDMCSFSAAHKTLPLPSFVRVTRLDTGDSVVVRVNDRGPFHDGRVIDLSYAAAIKLGVDRTGTAMVEVRALPGGATLGPVATRAPVRSTTPGVTRSPAAAVASAPRAADDDGDGRRVVQVGAYREKANARRIAGRLEDAGIDDVDIDGVAVAGDKLWRVRIGPLKADAVAAVVARVRGLGLPEPRVLAE